MATDLTQRPDTVNNQDNPPKPSRVEKITAALTEIEQSGSMPDCVTETPGAFLWEFYKAWVDNGGQDGGKNRNSIRRMRDHWLTGDTEVKSLHPKLTGRIRISKGDAKSLISLFLGRWKFVGVKKGDWVLTPDGYAPFQCRDCRNLCDMLADAMYPAGSPQARIGLQLPVRASDVRFEQVQNDWKEVANLYRTSDAIINLSRHRAVLGPEPPETMKVFWQLFKYFYDSIGESRKVFIWIIDIGSRNADDNEAWAEFFNFEMLKAQFRAFASFDSFEDMEDLEGKYENDYDEINKPDNNSIRDAFLRSLTIPEEGHREKRWKWLCERSVVIIQNLRKEEFDELYPDEDQGIDKIRLKDIGVTAENILPTIMPHTWGKDRRLKGLYGQQLESIADATLSVFFREDGWQQNQISSSDPQDIKYYAHALTPHVVGDSPRIWSSTAISQELNSPGDLYDKAFRTVYYAACHRLKAMTDGGKSADDWGIAVAYLQNQGFRILRLPEFLKIHRFPGS